MEAINGKILVVDDDADIREVLKDRLEYLGYRVSLASHGNEGIATGGEERSEYGLP